MAQRNQVTWAVIRRLVRWWQFIGGREFGVYVVLVLGSLSRSPHAHTAVSYAFAFFSLGVLGYWLNDMFDEGSDDAAGKSNAYVLCSAAIRPLITAMLVLVVGYAWNELLMVQGVEILLAVQMALLVGYSVPPLRLKSRDWWGAAADALYGSTIPAGMTLLLFAPDIAYGKYLAAGYLLLTFLRGLRSILMHQIEDRRHDGAAHITTVPVRYGVRPVWRIVWRWIIPLESVLLMLVGVGCALLLSVYSVGIVAIVAILVLYSDLSTGLPIRRFRIHYQWRYWCNSMYERWIPLGVIIELLFREPSLWLMAVAFLILFPTLIPNLIDDSAVFVRFFKRWNSRAIATL